MTKQTQHPIKYVYCGPNLKQGKLCQYAIYKGMPQHCQPLFDEYPWLGHLFVPLSELVATEREISTIGTPLNKYYNKAMEV